jgi:hypothetical protein
MTQKVYDFRAFLREKRIICNRKIRKYILVIEHEKRIHHLSFTRYVLYFLSRGWFEFLKPDRDVHTCIIQVLQHHSILLKKN